MAESHFRPRHERQHHFSTWVKFFQTRVGSPAGSMVNLCPSLSADRRAVSGMANSETSKIDPLHSRKAYAKAFQVCM